MRYELFDYQREAAIGCVRALRRGRRDWENGHLSSFALSAITGSGKTVIATAAIEAMLHGSSDFGTEPDPRATFLWVTDDPALNRQTRAKMFQASDLLQANQLDILHDGFMDAELRSGRVYFLNVQKLAKSAGLSKGGHNMRQFSFWQVLENTIENPTTDLYLVVDEAHRGMKATRGRSTIVQRLIGGEVGSNPPAPVVWGISATIERFEKAMGNAKGRTEYPAVQVDIEKVRASGLVKDEIGLVEPDEKGTFGTTLLREAVRTTCDYEDRWRAYAEDSGEPLVSPVMVVQVPDKASTTKLEELVAVIESAWAEARSGGAGAGPEASLGPHAVAHVFGEHETISLGSRTLRWVPPESIQNDNDVRVVLAKTAISTGWDCPRAEVLYSERPARDATHIAQIVGRMVRQPLAHRIATDDALNSVSCFLPRFERTALDTIKAELEGRGSENGDAALSPSVVRAPMVFGRNPKLDGADEIFATVENLHGLPAPDTFANPLRRARRLVLLLTDDRNGALLPGAGQKLTKALNRRLDGLAAEFKDEVAVNVADIETADLRDTRLKGWEVAEGHRSISTHLADVERDTRRAIRKIREGAGQDYLAHRIKEAAEDADRFDIRTEVAALLMIPEVVSRLEQAATEWCRARLDEFAVAIKNTTGATRNDFLQVQQQTRDPEPVPIILRANLMAATKDAAGDALQAFTGHLYADAKGLFPVALNEMERTVIEAEIARKSFVAWYRNPSRATAAALRIAYQRDNGDWTSLQPDFLVVSRRDDGSLGMSIIDPHGDYLADAKNKLRALADYAERFSEDYVRIESISRNSAGDLRVLDLRESKVRELVRAFEGAEVKALYESSASRSYS